MTEQITDKIKRLIDLPGGIKGGVELEPNDIRWPNSNHPRTMTAIYGHLRNFIKANDNKAWDFYAGTSLESTLVFIVRQLTFDGFLDEYKLIFFTDSIEQARDLYLAHMPRELGLFGGIEEISLESLLGFQKLTDSIAINLTCELSDASESIIGLSDTKIENLSDKVSATIRLSRADSVNENEREYTLDSMVARANDANRLIDAGLTLVGYDDEDIRTNQEAGHPEEAYNENGDFIGYNHNQFEPAFKFNRFKVLEDTKELYASIEALDKLPAGKRFAQKLEQKIPIKFSLRAMGSCQRIGDKEICSLTKIEGGDAVKNPAMKDAEPIATYITDDKKILSDAVKIAIVDSVVPLSDASKATLSDAKKDKCCDNCASDKPCAKANVDKILSNLSEVNNITDIKLVNNLGEKAAKVVSPAKYKFRNLGDTNMNPQIFNQMMETVVAETDPEVRKKLGAMANLAHNAVMAAEETTEGEGIMAKKEDPIMPPKKEDPAMKDPMMDAKAIQAQIQKGIEDGLKAKAEEIRNEIKSELKSELSILDENKKEKADRDAKKAVTDALANIVKSNEFEGRKLENYSEIDLQDAIDLAGTKSSVEEVNKSLRDSFTMYDKKKARAIANGEVALRDSKGIIVINDEAVKQYKQPLSILEKAVADCEQKKLGYYGKIQADQLAKVNKPMADAMWEARLKNYNTGSAIADWGRRAIKDSANPITMSDLRNQEGVIAGVIEQQAFQKLKAKQWVRFLGPSEGRGDLGKEFKIPSTGFTPPTAGTTRKHGEIREGETYGESVIYQMFNKFYTRLRGRVGRIGKELQIALQTGVLKLDAVALLISNVSDEIARLTDAMILEEIHVTIAEYGKTLISAQAVASTEWTYSSGGAPTVNIGGDIGNVTFGANVHGVAIILTGDNTTTTLHTANDRTVHPAPICPGRTTYSIDDNNLGAYTDNNDATVATLGGITQVEGDFVNGQIVTRSDGSSSPPTATYAVAKELGVVVFRETAVSGAASGVRPTITCYYDRNYDEFNLTPSAGVKPEQHYSGIIRLLNAMRGIMSDTPNFANPDLFIQHTSIAMSTLVNADLFEVRKQPGDILLQRGFAESGYITDLGGLDCMHGNGEFLGGARRGYLYEREAMSAYFVSRGIQWSLQNQSTKAQGSIVDGVFVGARNTPIPEYFWTADIVDGVGTPVVLASDGTILQHKGRSIRYVGDVAFVANS